MSRGHQAGEVRIIQPSEATHKSDVERKRTTQKLKFLSNYDALTTLPNRVFLRNKLAKAIKAAQQANREVAVLFISLDPYQRINETLGPAMGDRLVRCVAKRLRDSLGTKHTIGYWGNAEFVLLLEYQGEESEVLEVVQKVKNVIQRRFLSFGQEFFLTSSVGIALYPTQGVTVESLLRNASAAQFQAKQFGENGCLFYEADMNVRSLRQFTLENSLGRGIQRQEFSLHYQPQWHTGSWQITGAEALIRWQHPELGEVSPDDFIPLAEKSGLIIPIGEWALRESCVQLRKWQARGFKSLKLAINVSGRQFREQRQADTLIRILAETGLDPRCIELELTESSLLANTDRVVESLLKLKAAGVKLAIDDFGTGFSSLEYLSRLPLDTLKIDKSFVKDASEDGIALLSSIINMARKLRLRVVAEGVETREQLTLLKRFGCNSMQGFLFSRPLPGEQFTRVMDASAYSFESARNFGHGRNASRQTRAAV